MIGQYVRGLIRRLQIADWVDCACEISLPFFAGQHTALDFHEAELFLFHTSCFSSVLSKPDNPDSSLLPTVSDFNEGICCERIFYSKSTGSGPLDLSSPGVARPAQILEGSSGEATDGVLACGTLLWEPGPGTDHREDEPHPTNSVLSLALVKPGFFGFWWNNMWISPLLTFPFFELYTHACYHFFPFTIILV